MCLTNVTKKFKPNDKMRVGYKICKADSKTTFHGMHYNIGQNAYEFGKCYESSDDKIHFGSSYGEVKSYDAGFHIYTYKKDAIREMNPHIEHQVVVEVIAWDIRAVGEQMYESCFVAKYMRPIRFVKGGYKVDPIYSKKWKGDVEKLREVIELSKDRKSPDYIKGKKLYLETMTKSYAKYKGLVAIIDRLKRFTSDFLTLTHHHFNSMRDTKYRRYYMDLMSETRTNPKLFKDLFLNHPRIDKL